MCMLSWLQRLDALHTGHHHRLVVAILRDHAGPLIRGFEPEPDPEVHVSGRGQNACRTGLLKWMVLVRKRGSDEWNRSPEVPR